MLTAEETIATELKSVAVADYDYMLNFSNYVLKNKMPPPLLETFPEVRFV